MIYLDYNSTTPIKPEVTQAMMPYLTDRFYNPSSAYNGGVDVFMDITKARNFFAATINAKSAHEIYFTASGSEADNWALKGLGLACPVYIVTDNIEHHAILNCVHSMVDTGRAYSRILYVNSQGCVDDTELEKTLGALPADSIAIVSIMMINNEIGIQQNIKHLATIARKYHAYFHTDAVQAYGKIPIDVQDLGVDMLSVSSHKIGAPRGAGFLYVREGTPIIPLIDGGQQEHHMRAGTENVAAIMGFAKAAEIAMENRFDNLQKIKDLSNYFKSQLKTLDKIKINNDNKYTFPNTISVNMNFPAERVVAYLNEFDICVSSGSACNSRDNEPSHVLRAIGLNDEEANNTIRFSLSADNTKEEIDEVMMVLRKMYEVMG